MGDPEHQSPQVRSLGWPQFNDGSRYPAVAWGGIFKEPVKRLFESAAVDLGIRAGQDTLGAVVIAFGVNPGEVAHVSYGDTDPELTGLAMIEAGRKILENAGVVTVLEVLDSSQQSVRQHQE